MLSPHGSIFQTWFLFHKVEVGCSILLWIWCFFWWLKKIYTKIHYWEINLILQISRDKFLEWYLAAMNLSSVKLLAHLNVVMPGSDVAWSTRLRNKDREVPKCNQRVVWHNVHLTDLRYDCMSTLLFTGIISLQELRDSLIVRCCKRLTRLDFCQSLAVHRALTLGGQENISKWRIEVECETSLPYIQSTQLLLLLQFKLNSFTQNCNQSS